MHPQRASRVGTGSHHTAFFGSSTHGKGFAAQFGGLKFFDSAEKCIQIQVKYDPRHMVIVMVFQASINAKIAVHF
jgi:hypothetical protein